jgi:hypothetical protein
MEQQAGGLTQTRTSHNLYIFILCAKHACPHAHTPKTNSMTLSLQANYTD